MSESEVLNRRVIWGWSYKRWELIVILYAERRYHGRCEGNEWGALSLVWKTRPVGTSSQTLRGSRSDTYQTSCHVSQRCKSLKNTFQRVLIKCNIRTCSSCLKTMEKSFIISICICRFYSNFLKFSSFSRQHQAHLPRKTSGCEWTVRPE